MGVGKENMHYGPGGPGFKKSEDLDLRNNVSPRLLSLGASLLHPSTVFKIQSVEIVSKNFV